VSIVSARFKIRRLFIVKRLCDVLNVVTTHAAL
jgi:hypothetical protein